MPVQPRSLSHVKIGVYSGLTLGAADVQRWLPHALMRPPVKQFDLLADIREGYHVIVIVDGVFHQTPAVSPSEIMDALRRGILVYGCSSMGALRAAELYPYGMRGHGAIYEWIRSEPTFRDDFPGQVFSCEGGVIRPLSATHVDFVFNLKRLLARGTIDARGYRHLERTFRDLYYPDRTLPALRAALSKRHPHLIPAATRALTRMPSQKRIDALATLRRVARDLRAIQRDNDRLARGAEHRLR